MAGLVRFVTILCLVVGVAANAYIWQVTGGKAWAWDVMKWPVLLPNILKAPEATASIVYAAAIFPTVLGGLLVLIALSRMLGRKSGSAATPAKKASAAAGGDAAKAPLDPNMFVPHLAAPTSLPVARPGMLSAVSERFGDATSDLKEAFGFDLKKWKLNRLKRRGDDQIIPLKAEAVKKQESMFSRIFRKSPTKAGPKAVVIGSAPTIKNPHDTFAFEVMEWYGVWGKAGPARRTEQLYEQAYDLRGRMTQAAENRILELHMYTGQTALDALISATMNGKGIGHFAEEGAEPISQPSAEDLVDPEMQQSRQMDIPDHGQAMELDDENLSDDGMMDPDAPVGLQSKAPDPVALRAYWDQRRAQQTQADGRQGLEKFAKAGGGSAADFKAIVSQGGAEDGKSESGFEGWGGAESATEGGTEGPGGAEGTSGGGLMPWEQYETPSGEVPPLDGETPGGWGEAVAPEDEQTSEGGEGVDYQDEGEPTAPSDDEEGIDWSALDIPSASGNETSLNESGLPAWGDASSPVTPSSVPEAPVYDPTFFPDYAPTVRAEPSRVLETEAKSSTSSSLDIHERSSEMAGGEAAYVPSLSAPLNSTQRAEEDGAVSALLASVSPNGPIREFTDDDFKEAPEDLALSASTMVTPDQMNKTIRKMDRNWLRFVTGEIDKSARTLERQFVESGLAELDTRHVFLPALWAQLNKVTDYQMKAYAWEHFEHFGEVPPEHLRTPQARAEFLFDTVTSIVALAQQIPQVDIQKLLDLKAGTEQARWLDAGRAERMVAELKRSGAIEPKRSAAAGSFDRVSAPAPVAEKKAEPVRDETPALTPLQMAALTMNRDAGGEDEDRPGKPVPAEAWSEEDLTETEDGNSGAPSDWNWTGTPQGGTPAETAPAEDTLPSFTHPSEETPTADEPVNGNEGAEGETESDATTPNGPSSYEHLYEVPQEDETPREILIKKITAKAELDGIKVKTEMRFKSEGASESARVLDILLGKTAVEHGPHLVPVGDRVVVINVVEVPEGQWRTGKGENGAPLLKYAGKTVELRTWAFRLAETYLAKHKVQDVKKVLLLSMDPLAHIEGEDGLEDAEAVMKLVDEEILVRTRMWDSSEWREQVAFPILA